MNGAQMDAAVWLVEQAADPANKGISATLLTIAGLLTDRVTECRRLQAELDQVREAYDNRTRDWHAQGDAYDQAMGKIEELEAWKGFALDRIAELGG